MSLTRRFFLPVALAGILQGTAFAFSPEAVVITPTTFDFGWCPDNSKISAGFIIKNTGTDIIPITSVQPTCGCTASQFTPGSLSTNDETKVSLTFNTRGYGGSGFAKTAKVKTDAGGAEYTVNLKGFVMDPQAKIFPDQDGVAAFEPGTKEKEKTINIQNKSDKDITLEIVQQPAGWASVKLDTKNVKAGASTPIVISVSPPFDEAKDTSVTIEAKSATDASRMTVAIRTGPPPPPLRRASTSAPAPQPAPTPSPGK